MSGVSVTDPVTFKLGGWAIQLAREGDRSAWTDGEELGPWAARLLLERVLRGEAGSWAMREATRWLRYAGVWSTEGEADAVPCRAQLPPFSDLEHHGVTLRRRLGHRPVLSFEEVEQSPFISQLTSANEPQTEWIEVVFVDADDEPVPHTEFALRLPDGRTRTSRANGLGIAHVRDLSAGECELTLTAIDTQRWELAGAANDGEQSEGTAASTHTVRQGECIELLAERSGHTPETIWEHPQNDALRQRRPSLQVLAPGDTVYVPPLRCRTEPVATGSSHRVTVQRPTARLIMRFVIDDEPRANEDYTLSYRGHEVTGTTDGDGVLDEPIPFDLPRATVRFASTGEVPEMWLPEPSPDADDPELEHEGEEDPVDEPSALEDVYEFDLRWLDPSAEPTGAQARLHALGFEVGAIDGDAGPRTTDALRTFQLDSGLDPTGELDERTVDALSNVIVG